MRKRKGHNMICYESDLICPECGRQFPIPRRLSQSRKKGHIKTVWCPYCKKMENMTEIRWQDVVRTMSGEMLEV